MKTKIKVKRKELYLMAEGLAMVSQAGSKFTYCISKTKESINNELIHMDKWKEPKGDYKKFIDEINELRKKHAKKDRRGQPVMIPRVIRGKTQFFYDIPDQDNEDGPFLKDVIKVEKKYDAAINEQAEKVKEFNEKFLEEEIEIDVWMVKFNEIPEKITQEEMDVVLRFIIPDEDEKKKK